MLIVSLKQHFPARWPEWFMSALLVTWGGYTVLFPEIFTQPATAALVRGMIEMAGNFPPSAVWGLTALSVGVVRAVALFINGAYTRTPLIRVLMSFASSFIFTQVSIGFLKSGVPNWGLVVYPGLVVMDIVSVYRAATDMVYAEKTRHDIKQERRRVASSSSNA